MGHCASLDDPLRDCQPQADQGFNGLLVKGHTVNTQREGRMKVKAHKYFWALKWKSHSKVTGHQEYIVWLNEKPLIFKTRGEARNFRIKNYGYIVEREDLRKEPFGWKMPKVIRVRLTMEER
jgi:hypothetical protein